ncbi:MAG: CPBP family intramembrane metalloprotease [Planctomycetota bacterium]|nr:MAG: CPBP family intramembrane metalloprotease [Planctomycetota bacterium]
MRWRNVRLIFYRELRDQLRDRRTLFMVAVLPLLLYPALGIGMMQMAVMFREQPRTVVILGARHLPDPPLFQGRKFVRTYFRIPDDADSLDVIADSLVDAAGAAGGQEDTEAADRSAADTPDRTAPAARRRIGTDTAEVRAVERQRLLDRLNTARAIAAQLQRRDALEDRLTVARAAGDTDEVQRLTGQLRQVRQAITDLFGRDIQVLILVPAGLRENIERVVRTDRGASGGEDVERADYPRPRVVYNVADEKSQLAFRRVDEALEAWEKAVLRRKLREAGIAETLAEPVRPDPVNVAEGKDVAANLWSKLFPALLVIMTVTGAFYPAVDLAAGEKERGTMETLLICPATRAEIVLGKFLTVMAFSVATAVLNLSSIAGTGRYMISIGGSSVVKLGDLSFPSALSLLWLGVLLVPLAALFSALCLALATFARSSKEGQYYLTPLLMAALGLTVVCLSPAVELYPKNELSAFYSVMPVANVALLTKALLLHPTKLEVCVYLVPVLLTSVGYSLLALWWAIEQFKNESVLFREAERFDLRTWWRHVFREKEATPSFTEAGFCFAIIMLLNFASLKVLGGQLLAAAPGERGWVLMKLLVLQQLVINAAPAAFMALLLTTRPLETLLLSRPRWRDIAVAAVLALVLHPLAYELLMRLQWFFPQLPPSARRAVMVMADPGQSLPLVLLVFAVVPGVCEELVFRGFMLSGFRRSHRTGLAIALAAVTFGAMHMIPQQVFNASLLGLVLGLLAVRSGSLFVPITMHVLFNAASVVQMRIAGRWAESPPHWLHSAWVRPWLGVDASGIRYHWLTVVIAAAIATWLLRGLLRGDTSASGSGLPGLRSRSPLVAR